MIADADGRARHITRQTTITGMRMTHIIRKIIPPAPPDDFPLPAPRRAMAESVLRPYLDQYKINTKGGKPNWTLVIPQFEVDANVALQDNNNPDPSSAIPVRPTPIGEFAPGN